MEVVDLGNVIHTRPKAGVLTEGTGTMKMLIKKQTTNINSNLDSI
jgi:hypothetical protein